MYFNYASYTCETSVKNERKYSSLTRRCRVRQIKQTFLIVCEGKKTEPDYFNAFRMASAVVKIVGQAMNTMTLVAKAINIREADRAKKTIYDQCWVVFDKDDFPINDFNQAIATAESNGFHVAYSNQAFEYWFLLHYNLYQGAIHRNRYADMLTKLIGMPYSKGEGFGVKMYNLLKPLQEQALVNAKKVLENISKGNPAQEESSTTVHKLVEELNKYL